MPPRLVFQTTPECARKQKGSENVIGLSRFHGSSAGGLRPSADLLRPVQGAGWVTVTVSQGQPLLGCSRLEGVGIAPRLVFQTTPECARKQKGSEMSSAHQGFTAAPVEGGARAPIPFDRSRGRLSHRAGRPREAAAQIGERLKKIKEQSRQAAENKGRAFGGGLPPLPLFAPCSANTCRTGVIKVQEQARSST